MAIDISQDVPHGKPTTALVDAVRQMRKLEAELREAEATTKQKLEELLRLTDVTIPSIMTAAGITSKVALEVDGNRGVLERKPWVRANIPSAAAVENEDDEIEKIALQERREKALAWLKANDYDAIMKNQVVVALPKNSATVAQEIVDYLMSIGYDSKVVNEVHHSTLTAWVKEMLKRPLPERPPADVFALSQGERVKFKPEKEGKTK